MPTDNTELTVEKLAEIESHCLALLALGHTYIPALCRTVRQLLKENERLKRQLGQGEKSDVFSDKYAALGHDEKDTL